MFHALTPVIFLAPGLLMVFVISFLKYMARQEQMLEWKKFSSRHFLGSTLARGTGYDMSAASWMDRFRYMEADAKRLANFQTIANFEWLIVCVSG